LEDIREKVAMFIMSQIIDQKGKFHCPNKQWWIIVQINNNNE
jgi:hypothetical protein